MARGYDVAWATVLSPYPFHSSVTLGTAVGACVNRLACIGLDRVIGYDSGQLPYARLEGDAFAVTTVEVFADILCPFTHVGLRTLIDRRRQRGLNEPRLQIRAWPLELVNGKPLDPDHVAAEIAALRASVRPDLFAGFSADAFPGTSMTAFALTAAADRVGDPALIEEVGIALRNALFEEGIDIGRAEVVGQIATRFGIEPLDAKATSAAVHADWEEGRSRGVIGSPHFFKDDGGSWFCPGLNISRDNVGNFVIDWKRGTEAFVDRLFA